LEPEELAVVRAWLLCGDCVEGEREAVLNLGARAVPALAEVLVDVPEFVMDPLRRGILRLWDPQIYPDSADYVDRFLGNALAGIRVKAALSLGDVDAERDLLVELLGIADSRGYHPEVRQALQWAIDKQPGAQAPVESISIVPDSVSVPLGSVGGLAVSVRGPSGQPLDAALFWSSTDPAVVSVDATGTINALAVGTARIVAENQSRTVADTAQVTVLADRQSTSRIDILGGNSQQGPVGTYLEDTLRVGVTDSHGNPIQVPVSWTVIQGGGTVPASETTTDVEGWSENLWRLGNAPGQQRLEARVRGGPAVVFRAEATPGQPVQLQIRPSHLPPPPPGGDPDTLRVSPGEVLEISAYLYDAIGNIWEVTGPREVAWYSSADSIARFVASGVLLGVRTGYAIVVATAGSLDVSKPVVVEGSQTPHPM